MRPPPIHWNSSTEEAMYLSKTAVQNSLDRKTKMGSNSPSTRCSQSGKLAIDEQIHGALRQLLANGSSPNLIAFTIIDANYADMANEIVSMAHIGDFRDGLLFVTLDSVGYIAGCRAGVPTVSVEQDVRNRSKAGAVQFAKFKITAKLLNLQKTFNLRALRLKREHQVRLPVLFFEADVWMVKSLSPLFLAPSVHIFFPVHLDNPMYVNIGVWFARPQRGTADFFEGVADHLELHPDQFDQDAVNCFLRRGMLIPNPTSTIPQSNKCITEKQNCCVKFGIPPESPWRVRARALSAEHVVCSDRPVYSGHAYAVHVLTSAPLTNAKSKKLFARETGLWVGHSGYYDNSNRRFLALDGAIIGSRHEGVYAKNEMERAQLLFLIAVAAVTNRTLIFPPMYSKFHTAYAWEHLDLDTIPIDWRPSSFFQHAKFQVGAQKHLYPLAVVKARAAAVGWSVWGSALSLETALQRMNHGTRHLPFQDRYPKISNMWNWTRASKSDPMAALWGALLREPALYESGLLVINIAWDEVLP
eukprot:gene3048-3873_t